MFSFLFLNFEGVGRVLAQDRAKVSLTRNAAISTQIKLHGSPTATASPDFSEYKIGPENVLLIDVYYGNGEKISQRVRLSSRGVINFPLIGEIQVEGLTVPELQDKLSNLLEKDYLVNPQVTVFIEEYSTVSIMGEVKKPGAYPIKGRLTVVELISLAEGFTKIAAQNKVKVIHAKPDGSKEETLVHVYDFMNKNKNQQNNVVLHAGDVVIVPESFF